jgi:ribosomal protein L40E
MFCNYCGTSNPDYASFCNACGKAITRPSANQASREEVSPKIAPPSPQGAMPAAAKARDSQASACIYCGAANPNDASFCSTCGKSMTIPPVNASPQQEVRPPERPVAAASAIPRSQPLVGRPAGVAILSVLAFLGSALFTVVGVLFLMAYFYVGVFGGMIRDIPLVYLLFSFVPSLEVKGAQLQNVISGDIGSYALIMIALAAVCALVSYGLWRLRKWGHVLATGLCVVVLLYALASIFSSRTDTLDTIALVVIVIPIGLCILVYLLRRRVKQAFARPRGRGPVDVQSGEAGTQP